MRVKNITEKTLFHSSKEYTNEIIAGNANHIFTNDEKLIQLENGKIFSKTLQTIYPEEFSLWLNGKITK